MWSFEGQHRKRPNISLSGASKLMDKSAFLEKLRKERETRENIRRREGAAVRVQSFIRGSLTRIRTNHQYRCAYDQLLTSASSPPTEAEARALCLKMLRMYRIKHDGQRLVSLCSLLVRNSTALGQWTVQEPKVWILVLSQLLLLALQAISKPISSSADGSQPAMLSHAGPLRLLEVITQPKCWATLPHPYQLPAQLQADIVFLLLTLLLERGYFRYLIQMLVMKTPPVDERSVNTNSLLASSLKQLVLYPIYLVATCRRPSEQWDSSSLPSNISGWGAWHAIHNSTPPAASASSGTPTVTAADGDDYSKEDRETERSIPSSAEGTKGRRTSVDVNTTSIADSEILEPQTSNRSREEPMDEGSNPSVENLSTLLQRTDSNKPGKSLREDDDVEGRDREKVLRISTDDNQGQSQTQQSSLYSAVEQYPSSSEDQEIAMSGEGTEHQQDSSKAGGKLVSYAFGGVAVNVPSNFINLTLYNLVEELCESSWADVVHHYLVPCVADSKLLLRHPAATHAFIQAIHLVLSPDNHGDTESRKKIDLVAPAKLQLLLILVPIKTALPTTSLQLYLQVCRHLVHCTASFLPQRKTVTASSSSTAVRNAAIIEGVEQVQNDDLDESEDVEEVTTTDDEEDDVDMDLEDGDGRGNKEQLPDKPPSHIIEIGEWCLAHINSPAYVSWLLDEVEASNLDLEVLKEFCGLTHTMLTAPCLSIFQCRLMYGVVGKQQMQRAMWSLLMNLYPCWMTAPSSAQDRRGAGNIRLLEAVSRGTLLSARDRDTLVPVLASFVTALLAVLATLHDSELVTTPPDGMEGFTYSSRSTAETGDTSSPTNTGSNFAFSSRELVSISATLRDVCVGLAELAHPDTRTSNLLDVAYKPTWDHCFKCCCDVVRQLHLRDTRILFCPPKHWLTSRISLPELPHTASYRNLLSNRIARRNTFMPSRWRGRAQLLADGTTDSNSPALAQMSVYERVRATVLRELPFVFSFTDRAEVFLRLVHEDRSMAQENSAFNVGPSITIRVRRTHIYEDSFEKLSQANEPNMRLSMRVHFLNAAGAVEAGVDGGGLFREFLSELLKSSFDPNRGFFLMTRENTLYPNPAAHLLHSDFQDHYYFIGRMLGKALYEKLLVEIPLAGFFLSKLLSRKGYSIEFHHLDSLDPELCRNLIYLKTHKGDVQELGLDYTVLVSELGHNRVVELVPDGANIPVTADNRIEYIYRMADFKLNKQIAKQCQAFRRGLHDVVPADWLQLFDWRELQTMISGSASPVNIADLKKNTQYGGGYSAKHPTIKLFWQVVEQFDEQHRRQLLKFVTSCSRPPLLGFQDLFPPFCIQPSGSEQRLPSAATCMNLLKLPEYSDPITLKEKLKYSITSNAGFELS